MKDLEKIQIDYVNEIEELQDLLNYWMEDKIKRNEEETKKYINDNFKNITEEK